MASSHGKLENNQKEENKMFGKDQSSQPFDYIYPPNCVSSSEDGPWELALAFCLASLLDLVS